MSTPYSTRVYEEVTSTQDVARSLGPKRPAVVIAARQTAGRGRSGAAWETAPRALALSLRLDPTLLGWPRDRWTVIPLAAGVATAQRWLLDLKWPNDLQRGEVKLGGLLVEASDSEVTIGIGLNLWWPDPPLGRGALYEDDPGAAAYVETGNQTAESVWSELEAGAEGWSYEDYCLRCLTIGRSITWSEEERGTAFGIDRSRGSLQVRLPDGTETNLNAGEVRHVRLSPDPP